MDTGLIVQTESVDAKALTAVEQAKGMSITTVLEFATADGFCVALKELEKEIVATFADAKAKAFAAHRAVTAAEAKHLEPVQEARRIIKKKMASYQIEQERLRREEEARRQKEADKLAEDQALADAEAAEKAGNKEEAAAILNAPVSAPTVVVPKSTPKAATKISMIWRFEVSDPAKVKPAYTKPDEVKIRAQVIALGQMAEEVVGGIKCWQEAV